MMKSFIWNLPQACRVIVLEFSVVLSYNLPQQTMFQLMTYFVKQPQIWESSHYMTKQITTR